MVRISGSPEESLLGSQARRCEILQRTAYVLLFRYVRLSGRGTRLAFIARCFLVNAKRFFNGFPIAFSGIEVLAWIVEIGMLHNS